MKSLLASKCALCTLLCCFNLKIFVTLSLTMMNAPLFVSSFRVGIAGRRAPFVPLRMTAASGDDFSSKVKASRQQQSYPKGGDLVGWYDIDGGNPKGEVLVGKIISCIAKPSSSPDEQTDWTLEIDLMDDYSTEAKPGYYKSKSYSNFDKRKDRVYRDILDVYPLVYSYIRPVDSFKVPVDESGVPTNMIEAARYTKEGFEGIKSSSATSSPSDESVVTEDLKVYNDLKLRLLFDTFSLGAVVGLLIRVFGSVENSNNYVLGIFSSLAYLYLLTLKTDSITTGDEESFPSKLSNFRLGAFALPFIFVSLNNVLGGSDVVIKDALNTITPYQYFYIILGLLTYRIPMILRDIVPVVRDDIGFELNAGSLGIANEIIAKKQDEFDTSRSQSSGASSSKTGSTLVLVSGARGFIKEGLVEAIIDKDFKGAVENVDIIPYDSPSYAQMLQNDELIQYKSSGGITRKSLESKGVKVIQCDVDFVQTVLKSVDARVIGVWVSGESMDYIKDQIINNYENGDMPVKSSNTKDEADLLQTATTTSSDGVVDMEGVKQDIEYALVSGVFEFTALMDGGEGDELGKGVRQAVKEAFEE